LTTVEEYCKENGIEKTTPAQYRAILAFLGQKEDRERRRKKL